MSDLANLINWAVNQIKTLQSQQTPPNTTTLDTADQAAVSALQQLQSSQTNTNQTSNQTNTTAPQGTTNTQNPPPQTQQPPTNQPAALTTITDSKGNVVLATPQGQALYFTDNPQSVDATWQPYIIPSTGLNTPSSPANIPIGLGAGNQLTLNNKPLFTFTKDTANNITGDGAGGVWHEAVVQQAPNQAPAQTQTPASQAAPQTQALPNTLSFQVNQ